MRITLVHTIVLTAMVGCAAPAEKSTARLEMFSSEDYVADCAPAAGEDVSQSCCKNYLAAKGTGNAEDRRPYDDFSRFIVYFMIGRHVANDLPVPNVDDKDAFNASIFEFVDLYCADNPDVAYAGAVDQFWQQVPMTR